MNTLPIGIKSLLVGLCLSILSSCTPKLDYSGLFASHTSNSLYLTVEDEQGNDRLDESFLSNISIEGKESNNPLTYEVEALEEGGSSVLHISADLPNANKYDSKQLKDGDLFSTKFVIRYYDQELPVSCIFQYSESSFVKKDAPFYGGTGIEVIQVICEGRTFDKHNSKHSYPVLPLALIGNRLTVKK